MINEFKDLYSIFERKYNVDFEKVNKINLNIKLPKVLLELYKIRDYYKQQTHEILFQEQDKLILLENLNLENERFDFLIENQGCFVLQTENSNVYKNNEYIGPLESFIITYVLQEFLFDCNFTCSCSFEMVKQKVKMKPLWINQKYVNPYNKFDFYLIKNNSFLLNLADIEETMFGTNDEELFNEIKN